ncbi:MAG: hypothetical protein KGS09_05985 [Nitrospirae bacterium]|nr:hypothetical protein [Nitrospirota bacterium]MBU6480077.1 hypothetical protein [Nitrospirota bacterium]MDE3040833.1 hypothetical protein [Nitrospirota bacterium]MDE3048291.1 hypothetical protein [Nitrospirota bacterium]MDE3219995.1 hypothetical protein [Nitrospirota bacterium]
MPQLLCSQLRHGLASSATIFTDIAQELTDRGHTVTSVPIFKAWAKILQ